MAHPQVIPLLPIAAKIGAVALTKLTGVSLRTWLILGGVAAVGYGGWATVRFHHTAVAARGTFVADSMHQQAMRVIDGYRVRNAILTSRLDTATKRLAAVSIRIDAHAPRLKAALDAVTPAERRTLAPHVQAALAKADTMVPLVADLRAQVFTVQTAAAERHAHDSTTIASLGVANIVLTQQRDSAIVASEKKVTKRVAGFVVTVVGGLMYLIGKTQ